MIWKPRIPSRVLQARRDPRAIRDRLGFKVKRVTPVSRDLPAQEVKWDLPDPRVTPDHKDHRVSRVCKVPSAHRE
jgi:hypothetical protein